MRDINQPSAKQEDLIINPVMVKGKHEDMESVVTSLMSHMIE